MPREFDPGTVPGSDYEMSGYQDQLPLPTHNHAYDLDGTHWLPKTDWSRDGIIANDD